MEIFDLKKGFQLVQSDKAFHLSQDSVLLSWFCHLKSRSYICDIGAGSGAISVLLCSRNKGKHIHIDCVEIDCGACGVLAQNIQLNQLSSSMHAINADIKDFKRYMSPKRYDAAVCNPPYFKVGSGMRNKKSHAVTARHESQCSIDDVCNAAHYALKDLGSLYICHKPERLTELFLSMQKHKIMPKRMQMVCDNIDAKPCLVLIEGRNNARAGIEIMPNFIIKNADGKYTERYKEVYYE